MWFVRRDIIGDGLLLSWQTMVRLYWGYMMGRKITHRVRCTARTECCPIYRFIRLAEERNLTPADLSLSYYKVGLADAIRSVADGVEMCQRGFCTSVCHLNMSVTRVPP